MTNGNGHTKDTITDGRVQEVDKSVNTSVVDNPNSSGVDTDKSKDNQYTLFNKGKEDIEAEIGKIKQEEERKAAEQKAKEKEIEELGRIYNFVHSEAKEHIAKLDPVGKAILERIYAIEMPLVQKEKELKSALIENYTANKDFSHLNLTHSLKEKLTSKLPISWIDYTDLVKAQKDFDADKAVLAASQGRKTEAEINSMTPIQRLAHAAENHYINAVNQKINYLKNTENRYKALIMG